MESIDKKNIINQTDIPNPSDPNFHEWCDQQRRQLGYANWFEYDVVDFIETQIKFSTLGLEDSKRVEITTMLRKAKTKAEKLDVFKKLGFDEIANKFLNMSLSEYHEARLDWMSNNFDTFKAGVQKIDREFDEKLEKLSQEKKK